MSFFIDMVSNWIGKVKPIIRAITGSAVHLAKTVEGVANALNEGIEKIDSEWRDKTAVDTAPIKRIRPAFFEVDDRARLQNLESNFRSNQSQVIVLERRISEGRAEEKAKIEAMLLLVNLHGLTRYASNINLHAANLQIHLQTIRNITGLLDDVNRQRTASKALIQTINHMINVLRVCDQVRSIQGIDINIRHGAISLRDAYNAFENTKSLLQEEILSLGHANEAIRLRATRLDKSNEEINRWVADSVLPQLINVNFDAERLYNDLGNIEPFDLTAYE